MKLKIQEHNHSSVLKTSPSILTPHKKDNHIRKQRRKWQKYIYNYPENPQWDGRRKPGRPIFWRKSFHKERPDPEMLHWAHPYLCWNLQSWRFPCIHTLNNLTLSSPSPCKSPLTTSMIHTHSSHPHLPNSFSYSTNRTSQC